MNAPDFQASPNSNRKKRLLWCLPVVAVAALFILARQKPPERPESAFIAAVIEIPRSQLQLRSARLYQTGATNPFNGLMVEHYPDGALRSRSAVTNGLLHGLSQGWHTNGQLQVSELFKEGVSHGVRTKWHESGAKLSEATIVEGRFEGSFRRWHDNGALAEEIEFQGGQPHGTSSAYYPNGNMKARARLDHGKVLAQQHWKDGESPQFPAEHPESR